MRLRMYYRSPEGGDGGGSGGGARTYTQEEFDQAKQNSYRGGFNEAKSKAFEPFLEKAREKGYDAADFGSLFDDVLGHAEVGKKNSKYNQEAERKVAQITAERDAIAGKYRNSLVGSAIALEAAKATNPEQVAKLLQMDYKFDIDDEGRVRVFEADGKTPVRKDQYTDASVGDIVGGFLEKNPHFVRADAKVTVGSGQNRSGAPNVASKLSDILNKPANEWSPDERKVAVEAMNKGETRYDAVNGLVAK